MSSFGLNIGLRALLTAQSSLSTVGHNISNANTEGYSRQNLSVRAARSLNIRGLQMGGGVDGNLVLMDIATNTVLDIIEGVLRGGK